MSRPTVTEYEQVKCNTCLGRGYVELETPRINLGLQVNPKPMRMPCRSCGGNAHYHREVYRDMDNDEWLENLEERISKIEERLNDN